MNMNVLSAKPDSFESLSLKQMWVISSYWLYWVLFRGIGSYFGIDIIPDNNWTDIQSDIGSDIRYVGVPEIIS